MRILSVIMLVGLFGCTTVVPQNERYSLYAFELSRSCSSSDVDPGSMITIKPLTIDTACVFVDVSYPVITTAQAMPKLDDLLDEAIRLACGVVPYYDVVIVIPMSETSMIGGTAHLCTGDE